MLFINFLCLFCLMVLANCHTISKSNELYDQLDEIIDSVHELEQATEHNVRHDRFHFKHRREDSKKVTTTTKHTTQKTPSKKDKSKCITTTLPFNATKAAKHAKNTASSAIVDFWRKFHNKLTKKNKTSTTKVLRKRTIHDKEKYEKHLGGYKRVKKESDNENREYNDRDRKYVITTPSDLTIFKIDNQKLKPSKSYTTYEAVYHGEDTSTVNPELSELPKFSVWDDKNTLNEGTYAPKGKDEDKYEKEQREKVEQTNELEFGGTASIETLLKKIKVNAIQMISEQTPAITEIITNAVTETTFEYDPMPLHISSAKPRSVITLSTLIMPCKDSVLVENKITPDTRSLPGTIAPIKSSTHSIESRSAKEKVVTAAYNLQCQLQNEIKYAYKKAKSKLADTLNKGIYEAKLATKAILQQTCKELHELADHINAKSKNLKSKPIKPFQKTLFSTPPMKPKPTAKITTSMPRYHRATDTDVLEKKLEKEHHTKTSDTTEYIFPSLQDDYSMLKLFEKVLAKSHEDNVLKMLTTQTAVSKRRSLKKKFKLSKRDTETIEDLKLKENIRKLNEGEGMPDAELDYKVDQGHSKKGSGLASTNSDEEAYDEITSTVGGLTNRDSSFEGLTNKIHYNEFVNGYKYYLNFTKALGDTNFSDHIRYEAHRHHNVDEIGKYILNKLPPMPKYDNNQRSKRFFFDDSDSEEQDLSTKSDGSWFKKHFYMYRVTGPQKKYHTTQTVTLRYPENLDLPKLPEAKVDKRKGVSNEDKKDTFYLTPAWVADTKITLEHSKRSEKEDLEDVVRKIETPPDANVIKARPGDTHKKYKIFNSNNLDIMKSPQSFIGNLLKRSGKNKTFGQRIRRNEDETDPPYVQKEDSRVQTQEYRKKATIPTNIFEEAALNPNEDQKYKMKNYGYVDLNLVAKPTTVVQLKEKKSFFDRFKFKKNKTKKQKSKKVKSKRQIRIERYSPFKKLRDLFKIKTNVDNSKNRYNDMSDEDYNSEAKEYSLKKIKPNYLPNMKNMFGDLPNITDSDLVMHYDDIIPNSRKEDSVTSTEPEFGALWWKKESAPPKNFPNTGAYKNNFKEEMRKPDDKKLLNVNFASVQNTDAFLNDFDRNKNVTLLPSGFSLTPVTLDDLMRDLQRKKMYHEYYTTENLASSVNSDSLRIHPSKKAIAASPTCCHSMKYEFSPKRRTTTLFYKRESKRPPINIPRNGPSNNKNRVKYKPNLKAMTVRAITKDLKFNPPLYTPKGSNNFMVIRKATRLNVLERPARYYDYDSAALATEDKRRMRVPSATNLKTTSASTKYLKKYRPSPDYFNDFMNWNQDILGLDEVTNSDLLTEYTTNNVNRLRDEIIQITQYVNSFDHIVATPANVLQAAVSKEKTVVGEKKEEAKLVDRRENENRNILKALDKLENIADVVNQINKMYQMSFDQFDRPITREIKRKSWKDYDSTRTKEFGTWMEASTKEVRATVTKHKPRKFSTHTTRKPVSEAPRKLKSEFSKNLMSESLRKLIPDVPTKLFAITFSMPTPYVASSIKVRAKPIGFTTISSATSDIDNKDQNSAVVDTTLLANDDSMDVTAQDMNTQSPVQSLAIKNRDKAGLTRSTVMSAKTMISPTPKQYFTTPIPMPTSEFDQFLKENQIDVSSVTSPFTDISKFEENWATKIHIKSKLMDYDGALKYLNSTPDQPVTSLDAKFTHTKPTDSSKLNVPIDINLPTLSTDPLPALDDDYALEYLDQLESSLKDDSYDSQVEKTLTNDKLIKHPPAYDSYKEKRKINVLKRMNSKTKVSPMQLFSMKPKSSPVNFDITIIDFDNEGAYKNKYKAHSKEKQKDLGIEQEEQTSFSTEIKPGGKDILEELPKLEDFAPTPLSKKKDKNLKKTKKFKHNFEESDYLEHPPPIHNELLFNNNKLKNKLDEQESTPSLLRFSEFYQEEPKILKSSQPTAKQPLPKGSLRDSATLKFHAPPKRIMFSSQTFKYDVMYDDFKNDKKGLNANKLDDWYLKKDSPKYSDDSDRGYQQNEEEVDKRAARFGRKVMWHKRKSTKALDKSSSPNTGTATTARKHFSFMPMFQLLTHKKEKVQTIATVTTAIPGITNSVLAPYTSETSIKTKSHSKKSKGGKKRPHREINNQNSKKLQELHWLLDVKDKQDDKSVCQSSVSKTLTSQDIFRLPSSTVEPQTLKLEHITFMYPAHFKNMNGETFLKVPENVYIERPWSEMLRSKFGKNTNTGMESTMVDPVSTEPSTTTPEVMKLLSSVSRRSSSETSVAKSTTFTGIESPTVDPFSTEPSTTTHEVMKLLSSESRRSSSETSVAKPTTFRTETPCLYGAKFMTERSLSSNVVKLFMKSDTFTSDKPESELSSSESTNVESTFEELTNSIDLLESDFLKKTDTEKQKNHDQAVLGTDLEKNAAILRASANCLSQLPELSILQPEKNVEDFITTEDCTTKVTESTTKSAAEKEAAEEAKGEETFRVAEKVQAISKAEAQKVSNLKSPITTQKLTTTKSTSRLVTTPTKTSTTTKITKKPENKTCGKPMALRTRDSRSKLSNVNIQDSAKKTSTASKTTTSPLEFQIKATTKKEVPHQMTSKPKESTQHLKITNSTQTTKSRTNLNKASKLFKRQISEGEVRLAKNVAALEVIVDLLKETPEEDPSSTTAQLYTSGNYPKANINTNSVQVHIAIPYSLDDKKKRSADPLRVRKIFSANMSAPVDLEYQVRSYEGDERHFTTTENLISPGMYLLVENKQSNLNGFALEPVKTGIVRHVNASFLSSTAKTTTPKSLARVTLTKDFIQSINEQLLKLYQNLSSINSVTEHTIRKRKSFNSGIVDLKITQPRVRRKIDWDTFKKLLGHDDKVCNCKCKVNKTMCKACAASDAVMTELLFEFDNLDTYMKDHCTEIQTFFWMNPTGGRKLRDIVRKINKNLNDYYKNVKGKCQGRTCSAFQTYIDKREFTKYLMGSKDDKTYIGEPLINDFKDLSCGLQQAKDLKLCSANKKTVKKAAEQLIRDTCDCLFKNHKRFAPNPHKKVKIVYSLDNINVNIISSQDENNKKYTPHLTHSSTLKAGLFYPEPKHFNIYNYDDDEVIFKNKKGFKNFFTKKKVHQKHFSKRETRPKKSSLLEDADRAFWHDYLNNSNSLSDSTEPVIKLDVLEKIENGSITLKPNVKATLVRITPATVKKYEPSKKEKSSHAIPRNDVFSTSKDYGTKDDLNYNMKELIKVFEKLPDVQEVKELAHQTPTMKSSNSAPPSIRKLKSKQAKITKMMKNTVTTKKRTKPSEENTKTTTNKVKQVTIPTTTKSTVSEKSTAKHKTSTKESKSCSEIATTSSEKDKTTHLENKPFELKDKTSNTYSDIYNTGPPFLKGTENYEAVASYESRLEADDPLYTTKTHKTTKQSWYEKLKSMITGEGQHEISEKTTASLDTHSSIIVMEDANLDIDSEATTTSYPTILIIEDYPNTSPSKLSDAADVRDSLLVSILQYEKNSIESELQKHNKKRSKSDKNNLEDDIDMTLRRTTVSSLSSTHALESQDTSERSTKAVTHPYYKRTLTTKKAEEGILLKLLYTITGRSSKKAGQQAMMRDKFHSHQRKAGAPGLPEQSLGTTQVAEYNPLETMMSVDTDPYSTSTHDWYTIDTEAITVTSNGEPTTAWTDRMPDTEASTTSTEPTTAWTGIMPDTEASTTSTEPTTAWTDRMPDTEASTTSTESTTEPMPRPAYAVCITNSNEHKKLVRKRPSLAETMKITVTVTSSPQHSTREAKPKEHKNASPKCVITQRIETGFIQEQTTKKGMTTRTVTKSTNNAKDKEGKVADSSNYKEASDPGPASVCDVRATARHVVDVRKTLPRKDFERYVRNVSCYRYKKLPPYFLIEPYKKKMWRRNNSRLNNSIESARKGLKWDWIRSKRSLLALDDDNEDDERVRDDENDLDKLYIDNFEDASIKNDDHNYLEEVDSVNDYKDSKERIISPRDHVNVITLGPNTGYDLGSDDDFEKLYKGENDVYRHKKTRRKRSVGDMKELMIGLKNLPPLKPEPNEIFAMLGDSISIDCMPPVQGYPFKRRKDSPVSWTTDRYGMLTIGNVVVNGQAVLVHNVSALNAGNYSCIQDNKLQRTVKLTVITLPQFNVVFIPMYASRDGCTYEDLKALRQLGPLMAREGCSCASKSVLIDEPICLEDKDDATVYLRATAILTACPAPEVRCSAQCRRDLQCALALLCAANAPALSAVKVFVAKNGVNKSLIPSSKTRRTIVTHTLRKKDLSGHLEFHQLAASMYPGNLDMVVSCPAGYYLIPKYKICAACPADTFAGAGDNACYSCGAGLSAAPGAARCRLALRRLRRYEWWWCAPSYWLLAGGCVLCACAVCAACGLVAHVTSRSTRRAHAAAVSVARAESRLAWRRTAKKCSSTSATGAAPGGPPSPSAVILARFFRRSASSSRADLYFRESQETKFEQWKEKNMPPPLPPIDFDLT